MSEHALLSPSGAKKWMTCTGSVAMEQAAGSGSGGSEYADEGTAAHALAAMCLTTETAPDAYRGRLLHIVDGVYAPDFTGIPGDNVRRFEVDSEFIEHVTTYVHRIREYASLAGNQLFVEERVPIDYITGEVGAAGTSDAVIYVPGDDELQVHDLKYGQGVKVFAERNPQGCLYLLGALRKFEPIIGTPARYRFVIHQPRLAHLDEWTCTHDELMAFAEEAKNAAVAARLALEYVSNWIGIDNSYLVPGDHCKNSFCKARATCPALAKFVSDTVGADFEVLGAPVSAEQREAQIPALPADLTLLGQKNAAVDLILDWCKQIRARVEAALFEGRNSEEVQKALGHKLVEGKKGNRSWADAEAVETLFKKFRLKIEEMYDLSLISPPSAEKLHKAGVIGVKQWPKVTAHITQKKGQPSVAPLDDPRPAIAIKPAADDFTDETGSDLV